jgi:hypothetical protein
VVKRAPQYQLDPNAVVAVAIQEGLLTKGGAPGDNGTSFGPWQLHQGGAYPASAPQQQDAANAWAWSDAGVDYALRQMQSVAGGLKGRQAVRAIVYRFERPKNPAAEYKAAVGALPSNDGGPSGGGGLGAILHGANVVVTSVVPGAGAAEGAVGAAGSVIHGAEATATFLGHLTDPKYLLRGLEVVAGGLFVLFGLYLLGRQAGVVQRAQGAAMTVAQFTPVGPEAKAAKAAGAIERRSAGQAVHRKAARRAALDRKYGSEAPF